MGHYRGRDNRRRRKARRRRWELQRSRPRYGPPLVSRFWEAFKAREWALNNAVRSWLLFRLNPFPGPEGWRLWSKLSDAQRLECYQRKVICGEVAIRERSDGTVEVLEPGEVS